MMTISGENVVFKGETMGAVDDRTENFVLPPGVFDGLDGPTATLPGVTPCDEALLMGRDDEKVLVKIGTHEANEIQARVRTTEAPAVPLPNAKGPNTDSRAEDLHELEVTTIRAYE